MTPRKIRNSRPRKLDGQSAGSFMSSPPGLPPHLPDETTSNQTPAAALVFCRFFRRIWRFWRGDSITTL